jgi:hypothetical protein
MDWPLYEFLYLVLIHQPISLPQTEDGIVLQLNLYM